MSIKKVLFLLLAILSVIAFAGPLQAQDYHHHHPTRHCHYYHHHRVCRVY